jgi:hypothetical protein
MGNFNALRRSCVVIRTIGMGGGGAWAAQQESTQKQEKTDKIPLHQAANVWKDGFKGKHQVYGMAQLTIAPVFSRLKILRTFRKKPATSAGVNTGSITMPQRGEG